MALCWPLPRAGPLSMDVQDIEEAMGFLAPQSYLTAVRRPPSPLPGLSLPIARHRASDRAESRPADMGRRVLVWLGDGFKPAKKSATSKMES